MMLIPSTNTLPFGNTLVTFATLCLCLYRQVRLLHRFDEFLQPFLTSPYSTSGAKEMIFMNFSERSSRVTGPKYEYRLVALCYCLKLQALPSKRMTDPSGRRTPFLVRTTTAFNTSPF